MIDVSKPMDCTQPLDVSESPSASYLYAVEFDDGIVKIGQTRRPQQRMYELCRQRSVYHKIKKVYISESVAGGVYCERKVTKGLTPCEGREYFSMPYDEAVKRIKSVVGDGLYYSGDGYEDIKRKFPNTNCDFDVQYRNFVRMIELMFQWTKEDNAEREGIKHDAVYAERDSAAD